MVIKMFADDKYTTIFLVCQLNFSFYEENIEIMRSELRQAKRK
jgi:hypothetical protein